LALTILVRTVVDFLHYGNAKFPVTVASRIVGILVVIIVLNLAHTVFGHQPAATFAVRPFRVIGILAGLRDILSASA
jgi:hypothetical protein